MAANRRFAAGDFGGKCKRGLPPFTISNDHSELAAARRQRRARELRVPARSAGRFGRGAHLQTHLRRTTRENQAPPFRTARPCGGRRSKPSPRLFLVSRTRFARLRYPRISNGGKQMAANRRFAAGDFGGKCERGLPPFTISNDHSELAAARRQRRARELRVPARSAGRFGRGAHLQTPLRRTTRENQAPPFRTARPCGGRRSLRPRYRSAASTW